MTTITKRETAFSTETAEDNSRLIEIRFEKVKRLEEMLAELKKTTPQKAAAAPGEKYNKEEVLSALASLNKLINSRRGC